MHGANAKFDRSAFPLVLPLTIRWWTATIAVAISAVMSTIVWSSIVVLRLIASMMAMLIISPMVVTATTAASAMTIVLTLIHSPRINDWRRTRSVRTELRVFRIVVGETITKFLLAFTQKCRIIVRQSIYFAIWINHCRSCPIFNFLLFRRFRRLDQAPWLSISNVSIRSTLRILFMFLFYVSLFSWNSVISSEFTSETKSSFAMEIHNRCPLYQWIRLRTCERALTWFRQNITSN